MMFVGNMMKETYHGGKWIMFKTTNTVEFNDYMKLFAIKRKPNWK